MMSDMAKGRRAEREQWRGVGEERVMVMHVMRLGKGGSGGP